MYLFLSYRVLLLGDCCGDRSLEVSVLIHLRFSNCFNVRFTIRFFQPTTATIVGSWIVTSFLVWKYPNFNLLITYFFLLERDIQINDCNNVTGAF